MTRRGNRQNEALLANLAEACKDLKKQLTREIKRAKKRCWLKLLAELDGDANGNGYKIVKKRISAEGPGITLSKDAEMALINNLFPEAQEMAWYKVPTTDIPLFDITQIREAARKLKNGKAPGLDRVPAEVVKVVTETIGGCVQ